MCPCEQSDIPARHQTLDQYEDTAKSEFQGDLLCLEVYDWAYDVLVYYPQISLYRRGEKKTSIRMLASLQTVGRRTHG